MGVTTVMVLLAHDSKNRKMFWTMLVLTVLMFFATFYIQAHYVIDAIAGVFSGIILYFLTSAVYKLFPKIP
jgi:membrane-associated phospholipid phosphatase